MHDQDIVHRDLKPDNLLINENCDIKIADYGYSRHVKNSTPKRERSKSPHVVSRQYRSPEIALGESYDKKADVWSLGCILYDLMRAVAVNQNTDFLDP